MKKNLSHFGKTKLSIEFKKITSKITCLLVMSHPFENKKQQSGVTKVQHFVFKNRSLLNLIES